MMKRLRVLTLIGVMPLSATVRPNPLFSDHAVLQGGREIPVWGTASDGEVVTVSFAGHSVKAITQGGHWKVLLPAVPSGGPHVLRITGTNIVEVKDVLVGEVWLAGGQSNMERQLGPRPPQKPILGWEEAAAKADLPFIREFHVDQTPSLTPREEAVGQWIVCTPKTAPDFSAVGFFFARELWERRHVAVGMIHSSWGGTPAEAWMSEEALKTQPEFTQAVVESERARLDPKEAEARFLSAWDQWYARYAPAGREVPELRDDDWGSQVLPGYWEDAGLPGFDGVVWYRRTFEVPAEWIGKDAELHLGAIDDIDTTWINGCKVGGSEGWNIPRVYRVPAGTLRSGRNVVAVRVVDTGGGGGLWGQDGKLRLEQAGASVDLGGSWRRKIAVNLRETGPVPVNPVSNSPVYPGALYKGMIAPLVPYALRGVIWYQGEANVGREAQYRTLFPSLIADWRKVWGQGEFPFLFVQIAPFQEMTPELREAQLLALKATQNTAMVVTLDCGDALDIHPANKRPMGERLAWAARALAYGEPIEYSGPLFERAEFSDRGATLHFTHPGRGLVAQGDKALEGFIAIDAAGKARAAKAEIHGDTVIVSAPGAVAVRYAWENVPTGNLFNKNGFPASPFRTDHP